MMSDINSNREQPEIKEPIDWEDRYKRLVSEVENTRKRLARNSVQAVEQMQDQLLLDMLPLADNLDRILGNPADDQGCSRLMDGVRLTRLDFMNVLKRYGVEPLEALDQTFDPDYHEATGMVEHPSKPGGTVVEVTRKGYLRNNRLLRPAQVIVSKE